MAYISFSNAFGRILFIEFDAQAIPTHVVVKPTCTYVYTNDRLIGLTIPNVPDSLTLKPGVIDEITPDIKAFLLTIEWPEGLDRHLDITGGYRIVEILQSEVIEGTHLHDCVVTDGQQSYRLVCGAANAVPGLVSVLALKDTRLASGAILSPTVIHGIPSSEMLCSLNDLGLGSLSTKRGIMEVDPASWKVGQHITRRDVEEWYAKRTRG